jgi:predicted nuclease with TOPRIM domain
MREAVTRLADAAETEAAFISKNRTHLLNQIKRLEDDVKSKDGALRDLKKENLQLMEALKKEPEGYPSINEDVVENAARSARNRTPSTSEFEDLLTIADDGAGSTDDSGKAAARGKRKAARAETAPSPKKGIVPGTIA